MTGQKGPGQRPFVIGLTGPIAAGKSTVAELLRHRGAEVIDADQIYRSLLVPGSEPWTRIVERFGSRVLDSDGDIDRAALGELVFRDPPALADLERITHPAVVAEIRTRIARSHAAVLVVEAVKLAQSGLASDVAALWFITADPAMRLKRLMSRPGMNETRARARLSAAPDSVPNGTHVDVTIDNSGDLEETSLAVDEAWRASVPLPAREGRVDIVSIPKERS